MSFNDQFLKEQANPQDLRSVVQSQQATLKNISQAYTKVQSLSEIAAQIGNLDYRAVDTSGKLRMIMSAVSLFNEFGISAHLAGFDQNGVPQFYVSADDGSLLAGAGAVLLNQDGITIPDGGDALLISVDDTTTPAYYRTYYTQVGTQPNIIPYRLSSLSSLISNGNFETGDFTSWAETDPSSRISVATVDGSYVVQFDASTAYLTDYISQSLSSPASNGCVISFRAKAASNTNNPGIAITVGSVTNTINVFTDWRNFHIKFYGSVSSFQLSSLGSQITYVDDVVVQPMSSLASAFRIQSYVLLDGGLVVNNQQVASSSLGYFRVRGQSDGSLLSTDPNNDRVGIGTSSPGYKLDVNGDVNIASGSDYLKSGTALIAAETNSNRIFECNSPGGTSAWTGTINGTPSGTSVVYNTATGTAAAMVPASTSQLAKMRLYNTTRGEVALISDCNTGTNTITLTSTVSGTWQNGDTITIASQTVSGGSLGWVDLQMVSGPTGKSVLFINTAIISATVGDRLAIQPFETFASAKIKNNFALLANRQAESMHLMPMNSDIFSMAWTGTPASVYLTEEGYLT